MSTARTYEVTVSLFLEYLLDARYEWIDTCLERFGEVPQAVFHEGNSVLHTVEYEADPRRRPLTYDEVQALFDAADARPGRIRGLGRKGALSALRDAAVLKTIYAYGTRRTESSKVDLADLRRNRKTPQYGKYGSVMVRFGKSSKGAPPKRRTVLLIPEMDWVTTPWTIIWPRSARSSPPGGTPLCGSPSGSVGCHRGRSTRHSSPPAGTPTSTCTASGTAGSHTRPSSGIRPGSYRKMSAIPTHPPRRSTWGSRTSTATPCWRLP